MLDEKARIELLQTFQTELDDHCRVLTRTFLQLEKEPPAEEQRELLDAAFRAAHSLKGAARAVGLPAIERLAHGLEDALARLRRGQLALAPTLFDILYALVDTVSAIAGRMLASSKNGVVPPVVDHDEEPLLRALETVIVSATITPPPGSQPPTNRTPPPSTLPAAPMASPPEHAALVPRPALLQTSLRVRNGKPPARLLDQAPTTETLRVPAASLDKLLDQLGELVVPRLQVAEAVADIRALRGDVERWQRTWRKLRSRLRHIERNIVTGGGTTGLKGVLDFLRHNETQLLAVGTRLSHLHSGLADPSMQLATLTNDLQTTVKRLRMVAFDTLAATLERTVRDLARAADKEVQLVLNGADIELDRHVLEEIKDPLVHLLRNALDHGIEDPVERRHRGKPITGHVTVTARQRGSTVEVEIEDDGRGLDAAAIRRTAAAQGLFRDAELATQSDAEITRLIFQAGFSTRDDVSTISGRGIGLDVVARNVESLGGQIDVATTPGQGTRFTIILPVTLATTRALLVEAGGHWYALPTPSVARVVRLTTASTVQGVRCITQLGGRPVLRWDGETVPFAPLAALLGRQANGVPPTPGGRTLALVASGPYRVALEIDQIVDELEIVVKPLGYPLLHVRHYSGATILGSGRVVPILQISDLIRTALRADSARLAESQHVPPAAATRQRVLVADDSLTTRTLERYILEAAGYDVIEASDGAEAFALLQEQACDIVVSDVNMPLLDGVALTTRLRADPRFQELPVILVTSLDAPEDRQRGLEAGADAYLVKSMFDQAHLLRTIQELV